MKNKITKVFSMVILSTLLLGSLIGYAASNSFHKNNASYTSDSGAIIYEDIFNMPKEAPYNYYEEDILVNDKNDISWVPTDLEWLNIIAINKNFPENSEIVILLVDTRTKKKFGISRIIMVIHVIDDVVIFSAMDSEYMDNTFGQTFPVWSLPPSRLKEAKLKRYVAVLTHVVEYVEEQETRKIHMAI